MRGSNGTTPDPNLLPTQEDAGKAADESKPAAAEARRKRDGSQTEARPTSDATLVSFDGLLKKVWDPAKLPPDGDEKPSIFDEEFTEDDMLDAFFSEAVIDALESIDTTLNALVDIGKQIVEVMMQNAAPRPSGGESVTGAPEPAAEGPGVVAQWSNEITLTDRKGRFAEVTMRRSTDKGSPVNAAFRHGANNSILLWLGLKEQRRLKRFLDPADPQLLADSGLEEAYSAAAACS